MDKKRVVTLYSAEKNNLPTFSSDLELILLEYPQGISDDLEKKIHDFLASKEDVLRTADVFLITKDSDWRKSMVICLQLYLTSRWRPVNQPIVLQSDDSFQTLVDNCTNPKNGFNAYFLPNETLHFNEDGIDDLENQILNINKVARISIRNIFVHPSKGSRHQITNEWAAYKLAYDAGLNNVLSELEKKPYAKTLYFKYLTQKINYLTPSQNISSSSSPAFGRYLLIDDNYKKGWHLVFEKILQAQGITLDNFDEIDQIEIDEHETIELIKNKIQQEEYKGILLDLRLTQKDDTKEKENADINEFTGGKILEELKNKFPHIPIIITTASNKAWNMRQLLDAGADGYYIKESPEYFPSKEVSRNNYSAFVKTIKSCKRKYENLAPFWERINEINTTTSTLIEEKVINGLRTKIEERIQERLMMFFGLLKRQYEDSNYNKRFYYSDLKLAFMTLWSCLNDLQYIHYHKNEEYVTINSGRKKYSHKLEDKLLAKLNLSNLSLDDQYLQKKKSNTQNKIQTKLESDYNRQNTIYYIRSSFIDKDYSQNIGEQITFLLLTFGNSNNIVDETFGLLNENLLADTLAKLKEKRNKLYLTHGNESLNSLFYENLEKDNCDLRLQDCAELFEIVYFLLKGTYVKIQV